MKKENIVVAPPPRRELSDDPVKFCNEISRLFRGKMREMDRQGSAMTQPGAHLVRSTLAIYDGIRQQDLVQYTHLRAPTVSTILRSMEEEGQVERKPDPEDLRAVRVYLTPRGRELDRIHIEEIKKLSAHALEGFSEEEIGMLMSLLPRIRDNLLVKAERGEEANQ